MEWFTALGLATAAEERGRKREAEEQRKQIAHHGTALSDAMDELNAILFELTMSYTMAIEQTDFDDLQELAVLFPLEEVLSLQGYLGREQLRYLQEYFHLVRSRYNVGQFTKMAIERADPYEEWRRLSGLEQAFCGRIWHALIELICRRRAPELMQQVINAMGKILYHFWFLENEEMQPAEVRYQRMISDLNLHAAEDQKAPYLRAVMLLQVKLAERYSGDVTDFDPCLDLDEVCEMDGAPNLCFTVYGKDKSYFVHFYAVKTITSPDDTDLIWEIPAGGGAPQKFFPEG